MTNPTQTSIDPAVLLENECEFLGKAIGSAITRGYHIDWLRNAEGKPVGILVSVHKHPLLGHRQVGYKWRE